MRREARRVSMVASTTNLKPEKKKAMKLTFGGSSLLGKIKRN